MKGILLAIFTLSSFCVYSQNEILCKEIIVSDSLFNKTLTGEFSIVEEKKIKIIDNCLEFRVRYGGGCGQVKFTLATNDIITTDANGKTCLTVKLLLDDNDDCEAGLSRTLKYDFTKYKVDYYKVDYLIFKDTDLKIKIVW